MYDKNNKFIVAGAFALGALTATTFCLGKLLKDEKEVNLKQEELLDQVENSLTFLEKGGN